MHILHPEGGTPLSCCSLYNETGFARSFLRPFRSEDFALEVDSNVVPCEVDYEFILRAVGLNGRASREFWTPPECVVTTPEPTTTTTTVEPTTPESTTEDMSFRMLELQVRIQWRAKMEWGSSERERNFSPILLRRKTRGCRPKSPV